ncbi:hypothetical protein BC938DRAFT_479254 [Jimgerdemannia flammicorona]|uniref:NAD-dependent epimerase/dehydratase domain-containing protein n=1 Tax=Jimgerdemannia flammicorona TaxID=994334 RepID=A0A433QL99_9FUNG|nr:hypothetical protein BC938DRAFT_479254 [Jimgerdemannia flammicorona]
MTAPPPIFTLSPATHFWSFELAMASSTATTAAKKVLVVGGTGFLGLNVCRVAAMKGWEVVSLSRRGLQPSYDHGTPDWAEKVTWVSGDSLEPSTYAEHLVGAHSVIHTVGILMEADYKRVVRSRTVGEFVEGVKGLVRRDRGNPLKREREEEGVTFERMNRDTASLGFRRYNFTPPDLVHPAITIARTAAAIPTIESFVYVSAMDIFPFVDPRYITTKREAERFLLAKDEFRTVVLRPGFIYSDNRPFTVPLATALSMTNRLISPIKRDVASLPLGSAITTPPLHVDTVARAAIAGAEREGLKAILEAEGILELAAGKV